MQLAGPTSKKSVLVTASDVLKTEGITGFYVGLSAALFRQATYTTCRLGSFNVIYDFYRSSYGTPGFGMKLVIGMASGGIGAFVGTPAEVALIRMTADGLLPPEQRRNYRHTFDALIRIVHVEGVTTLWRGAGATVTRAMIVNGTQLGTYAQAHEALLPTLGDRFLLHFVAAMISGFVTAFASLPVDIVKTRVQNSPKPTNQIKELMVVIKYEGVTALWKGFIPTYAKIGPHTVLTFIFLEQLNALYFRV
ncbi:mitochondrial 2-oxoglutarate/malate carrier protein-like isoform X2 [Epargyreus clarus]